MHRNIRGIKYLLAALLVLGVTALIWDAYIKPSKTSGSEPIENKSASEVNAPLQLSNNIALIPKPVNTQNAKLVELNDLGAKFNPIDFSSIERENLKKLSISEAPSDYDDGSPFPAPRVLYIEGAKDRFILTIFKNNTPDGSEETAEILLTNLSTSEKIKLDKITQGGMNEDSFYDYEMSDFGNKVMFSRYMLTTKGELSSIVRLYETQKTFKNKISCTRMAHLLKIDTQKNVLSVIKQVDLPSTNKKCGPDADDQNPNYDLIYSTFYKSEFSQAITKLNAM